MFNNGIPGSYPLAMSGLGASTYEYGAQLAMRLNALKVQGKISKAEEIIVQRLMADKSFDQAGAIISEREKKSAYFSSDDLLDWIPPGYKFHEQLIPGVANWSLYLGSGVVAALLFRAYKKRHR